jgi:metallophosphoesterase superfamily enzyme
MSEDFEITLLGERLLILPERVLFWPVASTLFVADPVFGRTAAFHRTKTVVESTRADLDRLGGAIQHVTAERVIFLGNLLHPRAGRTTENLEVIAEWRAEFAELEMCIIGNTSDAEDEPSTWGIDLLDDPAIDAPFMLTNHWIAPAVGYALVGGQHPGASLSGAAKSARTLYPCFWFGMHACLLPSFGPTTGLTPIKPEPRDCVYLVAGERVMRTAG